MPGDVYKPRRPGDAGHRAIGAGRGDSAGLGQVLLPSLRHIAIANINFLSKQGDSRAQADRAKQQTASLVAPAQGQRP